MKKILLFIICLLWTISSYAKYTLYIYLDEIEPVKVNLSQHPRISHLEEMWLVSTDSTSIEYPLNGVRKITIEETSDTSLDNHILLSSPYKMEIYSIIGHKVNLDEGRVINEIKYHQLPSGTYIVKIGENISKIIIK